MKYYIYEIDPTRTYGFTIGSRLRPDTEFREQVRNQIDQAMKMFDRESTETHSIAIVQDYEFSETGLPTVPELKGGSQYLIFAILYSAPDSAESLSDLELELFRNEVARMIETGMGDSAKIALILLQDCSVSVLEFGSRNQSVGIWFV